MKKQITEKESLPISTLSSSLILERIIDAFFALDENFRFIYLNDQAGRIFMRSKEELMNKSIWTVYPDSTNTIIYEELHKSLQNKEPVHFEHHGCRTGKWYEVKAYPSESGLSVFFIDITEKKLIEKELFKLEALNIIGEISASISHEIRNPLTTIKGFLQLLQGREPKNNEYYRIMIDEINRANSIITEFLSLAGTKTASVSSTNINSIIDLMSPLIEADALSTDKEIEFLKGDIPNLLLNEHEIRQLILNLALNGLEAMPAGGKLTIQTFSEENEIILSFKDQGTGISPEILDRIWVPFFTTKDKGTGLGLAVCYKIVDRHKGRIETITCSTGTTFLVRFKNNH
ncbi:ATP-binding protein [Desulfosporosinus sp. OT]|uniref:two-component system sensor histidine kinase NtrB n=1 Tax=Desulfosporosinus sp. OT TaxID=913865 RepID=UPI0002239DED|nr:ATP-binding protein [Desulfosporosinus sp. OT]EGW40772.1 sensory box protein [Desulfosporosinus sp. OT]